MLGKLPVGYVAETEKAEGEEAQLSTTALASEPGWGSICLTTGCLTNTCSLLRSFTHRHLAYIKYKLRSAPIRDTLVVGSRAYSCSQYPVGMKIINCKTNISNKNHIENA